MQKRLRIVQELLNSGARARTGAMMVGWGFVAIMALLFAVSAYQNRAPDPFDAQYANLPLPPGGDVTSTGSIGGNPQSPGEFGVFSGSNHAVGDGASSARPGRVEAELTTLRQEIVALRRTSETLRRQNEAVSNRLAMLENESPDNAASAGASGPPASSSASRSAHPDRVAAARPDAPARTGERRVAPVESDPLITGSIPKKPSPAMSDAGAAPRSDFGIDLGAYGSLTDAATAWRALRSTETEIVGKLTPLAAITEQKGKMRAHLVAGPFTNAADAAAACARLEIRRIDCAPTIYAGQGLPPR